LIKIPHRSGTDAGRHYHRTVEQQVRLVGTFSIGTDFTSGNGNVVMSENFLRYFANLGPEEDSRTLNTIDIGCSKLPQMLM